MKSSVSSTCNYSHGRAVASQFNPCTVPTVQRISRSPRVSRPLGWVLALSFWVMASCAYAEDSLEPFFGEYVGQAELFNSDGSLREVRDLDISISPEKMGGFSAAWISVRLVDGRRDVDGVKRWVQESHFERDKEGRLIESTRSSLFARKSKADLLSGETLRWARVDGNVLSVYSMAVLEDGRYELQIYDRSLTELGLDLSFRRLVDEELQIYAIGKTVRVGDAEPE